MRTKLKSIKWKFILILIMVISLATIPIGWLSYTQTSKNMMKDVERFSSQVLTQVNLNIDRYFREYEQGVFLLGSSSEFSNWLQAEQGKTAEVVLRFRRVEEKYIKPLIASHPEILSMTFLNENGNEMHYSRSPGLRSGYTARNDSELLEVPFKKQLTAYIRKSSDYLSNDSKSMEMQVISLVKKLRYGTSSGYIKIDISLEPTLAILNEIQLGETGVGFITNEAGMIMAHPNDDKVMTLLSRKWMDKMMKSSSGAWMDKDSNEMVIFETIPYTNWKSVATVPYDEIAEGVYRTRDLTILIVTSSLIFVSLLGIVLSSSITNRILSLRRVMAQTQLGHFQARVKLEGDDEVTDLGRAYNKLLDRLKSSIEQLTESRVHQQEAVLSILQSQINSHFLYNALESINSMATLSDHKEISATTLSLANMLRYTSSHQHSIVTIQEELDHLSDYLRIMEALYQDDLAWEFHVSEDVKDVPCLKAILQPIVENSVKHVLETTGNPLHVVVTAARMEDRFIRIIIEDNGRTFTQDQLNDIQDRLSEVSNADNYKRQKSLGLTNVHYRLKMTYAHEYAGLDVAQSPTRGARVTLTFPTAIDDKTIVREVTAI
ncbi:sensor histidine kinase [Cohnella herbarum]|uniref:Histidine kinase n=1 Tax=Cohnella herbarum TaxID=2728023 RepID=A0A7Z2ZLP5_9BACL|nr:sensor histidine kinase [Cohnella herbarum]QJD84516.1 histidine kinase [Cohnella herbarum]